MISCKKVRITVLKKTFNKEFIDAYTLALQKKSAMPPSKDYEGYATRVL